jgi:hypothetical protein
MLVADSSGLLFTFRPLPPGYIFRGQMTLSLGYDQPAFAPGVMEALWMELGQGVKEMLLPPALCADVSLRSFL